MEWYRSVCPYDCPDACGLLIGVENGKVVNVKGNPAHPFTRGTLCAKMSHYERTIYNERRILTPLKRTGPKGIGQFAPISWDEAVETIVTKWRQIMDVYGAEAILPYSYAGTMGILQHDALHALWYKLGTAELGRTICAAAKGAGWKSVMGDTYVVPPQEAQHSDMIILWSLSMLATNVHFLHDVKIAKAKGAALWCLDTYETQTARYADHFIRIKPGTDGAFALGVAHVLAADGLVDRDFLQRYVQGWDEWHDTILPKYTPAYVESITHVPQEQLIAFAQAYGQARAPYIRLGSGMSRYTNGGMTTRLISILPALVGAWQHEGSGVLTSTKTSQAFDKKIVNREDWKQPGKRHINMCRIGEALHDTTNPIKSLFVYSSNPACTAPDQNAVIAGLLRDDLFTVVHERFLTDTANYADIVLPATTSVEHNDIYGSYGQYTLGIGRAIIPPLGKSKSNWQVAQLLAKAFGMDDPFFVQSEEDLIDQLVASTAKWPTPVDTDALRRTEPTTLTLPEHYKMNFLTPSGKIEIRNDQEAMPLPDYVPPHGDDGAYQLVNSPDPRILDSSFNERDELTATKTQTLWMHPADAAAANLHEGEQVVAFNERGGVEFTLHITEKTAPHQVVAEGVWWIARGHGDRSINALTSQRLADKGGGSTFYDVCVSVAKKSRAR